MDKNSTSTLNSKARNIGAKASPKAITLALLRQFARAYCPLTTSYKAGLVLN